MKAFFLIVMLALTSTLAIAHKGNHGTVLKNWTLLNNTSSFKASFIKYEANNVWLIGENHKLLKFTISEFSKDDQQYIKNKQENIHAINTVKTKKIEFLSVKNSKIISILLGVILLFFSFFQYIKQKKIIHASYGLLGFVLIVLVSCKQNTTSKSLATYVPANTISFMKSIFGKFPAVTTNADDEYFYIASNGLPDHNMMVGITNWQQQVPINHNYTGNNSWAIPIQPKLAKNPLSTEKNLLKGAIAIASNGIPIFNPLNNRGEDANEIGELDQWGGHCGRADDYHYHLPPTHLQSIVGEHMPIAYAVDGFPVYGKTTNKLDEYLGKFNNDGSYQYHTISEYPYFIAGMRGVVKLDPKTRAPENQVFPQARTEELRRALRPLRGAEIIDFKTTGTNAYRLTYTLNLEEYIVDYSWNTNKLYTYRFTKPDGSTAIETYQR